jgi:hypothetical protein
MSAVSAKAISERPDAGNCNFKIGQTLTRDAFTDAAGKHYPADLDLTVESSTRETCADTGNAFWRVSAGIVG